MCAYLTTCPSGVFTRLVLALGLRLNWQGWQNLSFLTNSVTTTYRNWPMMDTPMQISKRYQTKIHTHREKEKT